MGTPSIGKAPEEQKLLCQNLADLGLFANFSLKVNPLTTYVHQPSVGDLGTMEQNVIGGKERIGIVLAN